jgi:ABC-2 type transport system ATP-binding protein
MLQGIMEAIRVESLTKRFGDTTAIEDISFAVAEGTTTALLGANGAGKTTTIAILLGLLLPTSGAVRVLGEDIVKHRYRVLPRLNFSSPYVDLPRRLTVGEILTVFARLYGIRDRKRRIGEVADEFRLHDQLKRPFGHLSAGQKARVSLAKAFLNRPEVLFLDEPTASLDPDSADWTRATIAAAQRATGMTVLLASHNMLEVERLADRVLILDRGRIVADGTPAEVIAARGRANLEEAFLDIARTPQGSALEARP